MDKGTLTSMNISLPEAMRDFVEREVAEGGYGTASEYFRELLRQAKRRRADERLEQLLLEAVESGEPSRVTPAYWEKKKADLRAKYGPSGAGGRNGKKGR